MSSEVKKKTNYKKWAFLLFILLVIVNLMTAYLMMGNPEEIEDINSLKIKLGYLIIASSLSLLIGIILTFMSFMNQEKRNYQFYIPAIGFPLFIFITFYIFYS